ncbi:MAG: hypothetical protein PHR65_08435 [Syntrophomonadaceae bacterium]|nr:hypothetical protein [Syntrophomonadaceae bacterium]
MNADESSEKDAKIEILIGNNRVEMLNRFSLRKCKLFMEKCENTNDFRQAFIKVVYQMYCDSLTTDEPTDQRETLSERDFYEIDETQLEKVLNAILDRDSSLFRFFRELEIDDPYERLHLAMKQQIRSLADHFKVPIFSGLDFSKFQTSIDLQNQIKNLFDSVSINANAFKLGIDFSKIIPPIDVQNQLQDTFKKMAESVNQFVLGFQEALKNIDFEKLRQVEKDRECHETLNRFGWWYLSDFDEELLDKIHCGKESIDQEEVDSIICGYYRANRCEKLKSMVKQWSQLPYFKARSTDWHQIVVIHGQKYYNSSVKLLIIMIEGVTRDFVRSHSGESYFKFLKVRQELRNLLENDDNITYFEFIIIDHILNLVDDTFGGHFNPVAPEESPDFKRDKQLHGQALGIQTEADSLKLFLQINELYRIFESVSMQEN